MEKEICQLCNGRGEKPCGLDYGDDDEEHPSSCPVCAGNSRAKFTCPDCDGSGFTND